MPEVNNKLEYALTIIRCARTQLDAYRHPEVPYLQDRALSDKKVAMESLNAIKSTFEILDDYLESLEE